MNKVTIVALFLTALVVAPISAARNEADIFSEIIHKYQSVVQTHELAPVVSSSLAHLRAAHDLSRNNNNGEEMQLNAVASNVGALCAAQSSNATMFTGDCFMVLAKLDTLTPGSSSSVINATVVDAMCKNSCFQRFAQYLRAWTGCLASNNVNISIIQGSMPTNVNSAASLGQIFDSNTMNPFVKIMGMFADLVCLKNEKGNYCLVQATLFSQNMDGQGSELGSLATGSASQAVISKYCTMFGNLGCCFASYIGFAKAIMIETGGAASSASLDQSLATLNNLAKTQCSIDISHPCNVNGPNAVKLSGAIQVAALAWDWWTAQSAAKQTTIKNAFCTDLAVAGGFNAQDCTVTNVKSGSSRRAAATTFDYSIAGMSTESLAPAQAALAGNVPLTDVSQATGTPSLTGSGTVNAIQANNATPAASSASTVAINGITLLIVALLSALFL